MFALVLHKQHCESVNKHYYISLMGKNRNDWRHIDKVLSLFGTRVSSARKRYRSLVVNGVAEAKRPDLADGGLVRSLGGWSPLKSLPESIQREIDLNSVEENI